LASAHRHENNLHYSNPAQRWDYRTFVPAVWDGLTGLWFRWLNSVRLGWNRLGLGGLRSLLDPTLRKIDARCSRMRARRRLCSSSFHRIFCDAARCKKEDDAKPHNTEMPKATPHRKLRARICRNDLKANSREETHLWETFASIVLLAASRNTYPVENSYDNSHNYWKPETALHDLTLPNENSALDAKGLIVISSFVLSNVPFMDLGEHAKPHTGGRASNSAGRHGAWSIACPPLLVLSRRLA